MEKLTPETVHLRNNEKRLSIDGEHRFFHIKVTFSNLYHPQFFLNSWVAICLAISKQYFRLCLLFQKHSSFLHNVNYLKKNERQSDVERW